MSGRVMQVRKWLTGAATAALLAGATTTAVATEVTITAEYRPSGSDPTDVTFRNTTPCALPGATNTWCTQPGTDSPVAVALSPIHRIITSGADKRDGVYVKTPEKRLVTVTNEDGSTAELELRIKDIGHKTYSDGTTLHDFVINLGAPDNSGQMCNAGGRTHTGGARLSHFMWGVVGSGAERGVICTKTVPAGRSGNFEIQSLYIGYSLKSPNPISMQNGLYRGSVTYRLAPDGDFSVGNGSYDQQITFNFELTVAHAFRLDMPANADRVFLAPDGGWGQWLNAGRVPPNLKRDLNFDLQSTGPLSVSMTCGKQVGLECGLEEISSGEAVPLHVMLTLPGMESAGDGGRVDKYLLYASGSRPSIFRPSGQGRSKSVLHFEVARPDVEEMVKKPGSTWRGTVTLIFDAEFRS